MDFMGKIEEKIIETMKNDGFITCVGIEHIFDELGFDYHGDQLWVSADRENVVFWSGWSADVCDAIESMMDRRGIVKLPIDSWIVMVTEGKGLNLPLLTDLKSEADVDPSTDYWLPVWLKFKEEA